MNLLLIEFAAVDRFHRAVMFPFLHGLARSKGISSRWLRFGLRARQAMAEDGSGVTLSGEDEKTLVDQIEDFAPTMLLFNMKPENALVARLARRFRPLRLFQLAEGIEAPIPADGNEPLHSLPTKKLLGLCGFDGTNLLEDIVPDFSFQPANRAALEMMPLPFLFLGEECNYNRSFAGNPFFTGLELSGCVRRGGCAFCTRPPGRRWKTEPLVLFKRQLEAVLRTLPTTREPLELRLVGEPAVHSIETICRYLAENNFPALELLIDCRADTLLRRHAALRRALHLLEVTAHRLEMCLMGVENFSSAELERLNKGLSPSQNLNAILTLIKLEGEFNGHFGFRRFGGLSLITYTPWTRPADLALNLAVASALEIEPLCGKLFDGRLRLYPSLPLFQAARRDGLLRHRYPDRILDTASRNMYGRETPWRFAQPAMERINRALAAIETGQTGGVPRALDFIDRTLANIRRLEKKDRAPGPMEESWFGPSKARQSRDRIEDIQIMLCKKPAAKIEPLREETAAALIRSGKLPNACLRRRPEAGLSIYELFCGNRAEDVQSAVSVADRLDKAHGAEFRRLVRKMGRLLGYPACCAAAFSRERPRLLNNAFWLQVARRIAEPGPVSALLNPAANPALEYIPCSLKCHPTLVRTRELAELWAKARGLPRKTVQRRLCHPWLLFRQTQGECLELIPQSEPGERFRFRAGQRCGESLPVRAAAGGDEIIVEPECLLVLRRGKEIAALSGRAFLWWHRRAFQVEFWRALLEVLETLPPADRAPALGCREIPAPVLPLPSIKRLSALLDRAARKRLTFGGFSIRRYAATAPDRLRLELASGEETLVIEITPHRRGAPAFLEAGNFLLTYPLSHPIQSRAQLLAAQALADHLAKVSHD